MGALCQMHLHGAPTSLCPSGGKGLPSFCGLFFCLFTHCKLQKSISTAFIIMSGSAFLSHQDQLETEKGTSVFLAFYELKNVNAFAISQYILQLRKLRPEWISLSFPGANFHKRDIVLWWASSGGSDLEAGPSFPFKY